MNTITINKENIDDSFSKIKDVNLIKLVDIDFNLINIDINSYKKCNKLFLDNVKINNIDFSEVFVNIEFLYLENQNCDIRIFSKLFPNLVQLSIRKCSIQDDFESIFKSLRYLEIRECKTNIIPKFIYNISILNSLHIGENSLPLVIPKDLINISTLRELILNDQEITYFNYPLNNIQLKDENDFFQIMIVDCTIKNFPKDIENLDKNIYFHIRNCNFENYSHC